MISRRGCSAMTLVELLLAVTLFSTLMGAVSGLVASGLRAQAEWGRSVAPYQQMERALSRLERDIESTQLFFGVPVQGEANALEFARIDTVPQAEGQPMADWVRVRYRLETDLDGQVLIREEELWRAGEAAAPVQRDILLHVVDGRWAFGMLDAQQQLLWAEDWDGRTHGVPRLVRFDYTIPSSDSQAPIRMSRVFRNLSGSLPQLEEAP